MKGRKIIQIAASQSTLGEYNEDADCSLYALCDDNTIWYWLPRNRQWKQLPEIPRPIESGVKNEPQ